MSGKREFTDEEIEALENERWNELEKAKARNQRRKLKKRVARYGAWLRKERADAERRTVYRTKNGLKRKLRRVRVSGYEGTLPPMDLIQKISQNLLPFADEYWASISNR